MKNAIYVLGLDPTPSAPAAVILDETGRVMAAVAGSRDCAPAMALRHAVSAALDQARLWPDQLGRCYSVACAGRHNVIAERYLPRARCLARVIAEADQEADPSMILDLQPGSALLLRRAAGGHVITKRRRDPKAVLTGLIGQKVVISGDPALCAQATELFTLAGAGPPQPASCHTAALGAALLALVDHHQALGLAVQPPRYC